MHVTKRLWVDGTIIVWPHIQNLRKHCGQEGYSNSGCVLSVFEPRYMPDPNFGVIFLNHCHSCSHQLILTNSAPKTRYIWRTQGQECFEDRCCSWSNAAFRTAKYSFATQTRRCDALVILFRNGKRLRTFVRHLMWYSSRNKRDTTLYPECGGFGGPKSALRTGAIRRAM